MACQASFCFILQVRGREGEFLLLFEPEDDQHMGEHFRNSLVIDSADELDRVDAPGAELDALIVAGRSYEGIGWYGT